MKYLFGILLLVMTAFLAVIQFVRNVKFAAMTDRRNRLSPWILVAGSFVIIVDMCSPGTTTVRLTADLMLPATCFILLTSSLWHYKKISWLVCGVIIIELLQALYYMAGLARLLPPPHLYVSLFVQVLALAVITVQFLAGIWKRMSSIKEVMKSGTIWTNVLLSVDALYPLLILLNYSFYLLASAIAGTFEGLHSYIFLIVAALSLASLALRIYLDAAFVLWQQQERRIVESMKVTSVESAIDVSRIEDIYKDIYERVVAYFENEKPFLDNKLTINDVVRSLYTNKLYISRAISQFTGRNFCQFVNYYRVIYSMQCFRENPDLKIYELATMSGFNSIVSYNMAFRLFMGENPSEWCRKEKTRKIKNKK